MALNWSRSWHGPLGAAAMAAAVVGSLAGVEWVRTWFYQIAWWSYILMLDAAIQQRQGDSLLVDRRASFWFMAFMSATFWFGWEAVNLRLGDWAYLGVPRGIIERWAGAFIAYATVLPGVLLTYELLTSLGISWGRGVRPLNPKANWQPWFLAAGVAMFALSLLWPRLFFPLVWGGLVFLLEPSNHRRGLPSLMRHWEQGDLSPFVRLLLAGMVCGLFWEGWNFLAGARWEYSIPYLNEPKLFAMPLAGYAGFPPFAVECYVFMAWLGRFRGGRGWQAHDHDRRLWPPLGRGRAAALLLACLAFDLFMCRMIDLYLVKGWL